MLWPLMRLNMTTGLGAGEAEDERSCARLRLQPGTPHKNKYVSYANKLKLKQWKATILAGTGGGEGITIVKMLQPRHWLPAQNNGES